MLSLTNKQQRDLLIALGVGDFLVGGKITNLTRKAVSGFLRTVGPPAGRAAIRGAPRFGSSALLLARRHPVILAAALAHQGYIHRDEVQDIVEDIREGLPEVMDMVVDLVDRRTTRAPIGQGIRRGTEFARPDYSGGRSFGVLPTQTTKKRPSKFNQAVKAGMAAVKKSTSYGGKGVIKPAKRAFSVVVKLAAAKKKKKKAPKSGIKRKIWNAMRGY
jgi:hypothetical protein